MNYSPKDLNLLPNYFKIVGLVMIGLCILFAVSYLLFNLSFDQSILKRVMETGILISLLIIALSRDKEEDEMTMRLRLKAFAATFIYGVVIIIIEPFVNLMFNTNSSLFQSSAVLLISMFIFYFIILFLMKRNR